MRGWRRRRPDHQRSSHEIRREGPCCMNLPGAMVSIPIFHIATRSATSFRRRNTGSLTGQPTLGRFRIRAKIGHKVCSKGSGRGSSGSGRLSMSSAYRQSARVAAHIGAGRAIAAQRVRRARPSASSASSGNAWPRGHSFGFAPEFRAHRRSRRPPARAMAIHHRRSLPGPYLPPDYLTN